MSVISGSLRKLAIRRGGSSGTWEDVAHVVSDNWNTQTDFIETTTRDNKGFKSFIPIAIGSTIEATGLIFQDGDLTGKIGWKTLKEVQEAFEKIEYRMQVIGESYTYYGNMYIASVGDTAEVSGLLEYSISFQVTDKPVELGDNVAPSVPILMLDSLLENSATLIWTAATDDVGVMGYELRKSRTNVPDEIIDVGNVLQFTDNSLLQATFYSFNVRAYDLAGNFSAWSNKVKAFTLIPGIGQENTGFIFQDGVEIMYQDRDLKITQE